MDFDAISFRAMRRAMRHTPWYGSKFLYENIETWKQELVERRLCKRVAQVLVCSEDDRRVLGYDNVRVLPNCVDLPLKLPAGSVEDPHRLLFIGKMDYEPNIDAALYFCKAIFPHIRKVEPRLRRNSRRCTQVSMYSSLVPFRMRLHISTQQA